MSRRFAAAATSLVAVAGLACSSPSGNPDGGSAAAGSSVGGSSGGVTASSGGASSSGSASGSTAGGGSSTGSASSGGSSGGGVIDGGVLTLSAASALPAQVENTSDDSDAGVLWVITDGLLADGGWDNGIYLLDDTTLATLVHVPLPSSLTVNGETFTPFSPTRILALPGLHKAYFGLITGPGGVDAVDEVTHTVTTVLQLSSNAQSVTAFAYDSARQLVYVLLTGFYETPGYVDIIDATTDQLVTTLQLPDAGDPGSICSATSSTSCFEGQTDLAVDATGQELYLAGYDQFFAPMAATLLLDGGTLQNVLGGQAAGWLTPVNGIVTFDDGGGFVAAGLVDGGAIAQLLESPPPTSLPQLPSAIAHVDSDVACADRRLDLQVYPNDLGELGLSIDNGFSVQEDWFLGGEACAGMSITSLTGEMRVVGTNPFKACLAVRVVCQPDPNPDGGATPNNVIAYTLTNYCCPPN